MALPVLYLAWRGLDDNAWQMYGNTVPNELPYFTPQYPFQPFYGTELRPALCALPDRLMIAGYAGLGGIWYGHLQNGQWAQQQKFLPASGTSWATAMVPWKTGALMVWNGLGSDTRIWCSQYNVAADDWSTQFLADLPGGHPIQSGSTPAIVNNNGVLLMVWRGEGSNDSLYYAVSHDGVNWTGNRQIPGAASTIAPSMTMLYGKPVLVFKGGVNDTGIYTTTYNAVVDNWSPVAKTGPFGTSHSPCVTIFRGQLFMTWKGIPGDNALYWAVCTNNLDQRAWSGQGVIGNTGSPTGPVAAVF